MFVTIDFEEKDASRSKMQAITEYLMDVKDNAKEYNSALHVAGIFSFEDDCPIENWLYNSVDTLKGFIIELPTTGWTCHNSLMKKNGPYCILFLWKE